ncbi:uncharacterized protein NEPG_00506 [Nematocida parisii ERTm1]|uniref:uncharacterized protein n=1 Tax=Nematocida parisii (strain ERTm1 / ATCC PRA-289) TaxID=881290 RepID=UPI000264B804|nr:uncharacterized protein NEPG_00506 [Nematocida parisii ERTm1]EIJ94981.1 hypothetical protein NEPG_00506 [Nematocida parisii ERTm1]|eukprot:XP_013058337.1 hypothetical protein NEPG_00506 [Nematocida parisii ERTm1]
MFEYKRPISSILDGPRFTIAKIGNTYCVVAAVNNFYTMYGAEKLNTIGMCKEGETIKDICTLDRYVATATGTTINIYNNGVQIQEIEVGSAIKSFFPCDEYIVAVLNDSVVRIYLNEIEEIEKKQLEYTITKLNNIPMHFESVHQLTLKNKVLVVAQGKMCIYSVDKDKAIYTLKCTEIGSPVVDVSCSISAEIIAVCTASDVLVLQLKKDILLQKFSFESIQSLDFRRSGQCKDLAVLTEKEVIILCLEQGFVKSRHALKDKLPDAAGEEHMRTARYIGSEGYLVISQRNELQILDCHKEKILPLKRRAGVVFGSKQCMGFLKDTLVISTNSRVYTLSLRKDEQLKEISKMCGDGQPVSLSIARDNILACYTKGIYALKETVGGIAQVKGKLGYSTPKDYIECAISFCGNSFALVIKSGDASVKILIASRASGFILGEIEERPYLAISLNNIKKTLTVLHRTEILVYSYNGEVLSKAPINGSLGLQEKSSAQAEETDAIARIVETRAYKYFVISTQTHVYIISPSGDIIKSVEKKEGAPVQMRVTEDLSWLLLLSSTDGGSVLEVIDIQSACILSTTLFSYTPRDFLITNDKNQLVVTTDKQVLLFTNTYKIQAAETEYSKAISEGICFSPAHKSRIRLMLMYDTLGEKIDEEEVMAPYTMQKENTRNPLFNISNTKEIMDAILDGNHPISSIITYIKEVEDPTSLIIDLVSSLETKYDISDALINRVIHYRRTDLDMERLSGPLKIRENISERLITNYLSVLSLIRPI